MPFFVVDANRTVCLHYRISSLLYRLYFRSLVFATEIVTLHPNGSDKMIRVAFFSLVCVSVGLVRVTVVTLIYLLVLDSGAVPL